MSLQNKRELHARKLACFQFEEAAFLSEHRITLRSQSEFEWRRLGPIETRIENHLRALRSVPVDILPEMTDMTTQDVGEFYASLRVHAFDPHLATFQQQLANVGIDDLQRIHLAAEALLVNAPCDLIKQAKQWLNADNDVIKAVAALVLGHLREYPGSALIALTHSHQAVLAGVAIWALGRCKSGLDLAFFRTLCEHESWDIREKAGIALLRQFHADAGLGNHDSLNLAIVPASVLALRGNTAAVDELRTRLSEERTASIVQAIGISGDVTSIPVLIELLKDNDLDEVAAQALNLITGANYQESIWIEDEMADEELFDKERSAFQADGSLPRRPDGLPFGYEKVGFSKDPEVWENWLEHNTEVVESNCSIRMGLPDSAAQSLRTLTDDTMPMWSRRAAADELVARYHIRVPFEVEWTVSEQEQALDRMGRTTE